MSLKNKTAIVGIGQTAFSKSLGKTELGIAIECSKKAIDDAGMTASDIDGIVRFDMEATHEDELAYALGIPELRFFAATPYGGGAGGVTISLAAMAIATGQAENVLCFRSRNRGKASAAGASRQTGGRPWEKQTMDVLGAAQYHIPFGLVSPVQQVGVLTRRHMHEFGTKAEHLGAIAVNQRANATRNPNAVMREPITVEDYLNARFIAEPMRLLDCCLETDGGAAVVMTSAENARNAKQPPAYLLAAAQGLASMTTPMTNYYKDDFFNTDSSVCAKALYERAGITPDDVDVAQLYDAFSTTVLLLLEDYICGRGNGGPFAESGAITWPNGTIPINTSGAGLSEVYLHGFNLILEAVRQIRGTSTSQVKDVEVSLYAAAPPVPTSAFLLSKSP
ncbi:MAG: lipid-transfer protein [Dehalococcoidia bacterium]